MAEQAQAASNPKEIAFPEALRQAEHALWLKRDEELRKDSTNHSLRMEPTVGFSLSGGGIRSATFCLGFFQALAKGHLLHRIDYLSSVSGGGFFSGFYGRLFSRDDVRGFLDINQILSPDAKKRLDFPGVDDTWKTGIFRWLRENGRYLAPNGNGDLLVGITVFLRNWFTVQLLIAVTMLTIFLGAQWLRTSASSILPDAPYRGAFFWWSPYLYPAEVLGVFGLLPLGWAYWMFSLPDTGDAAPGARKRSIIRFVGHGLLTLGALVLMLVAVMLVGTRSPIPKTVAFTIVAITAFWWVFALTGAVCDRSAAAFEGAHLLNYSETARSRLTQWLRTMLATTLALTAFALVDSAGQTLYADSFQGWRWFHNLLALVYGLAIAVVPFARSLLARLAPKDRHTRIPLSLAMIAGIGAAVVIIPALIGLDILSQAVAYDFTSPLCASRVPQPLHCLFGLGIGFILVSGPPLLRTSWVFINRTSLHALYCSRLIRAYLGASNRSRYSDTAGISDAVDGDDFPQEDYWRPTGAWEHFGLPTPWTKGAPLHLVNVTINETLDGSSQNEQRDRKGLGMAIGPAGYSVGVRHHVVLTGATPDTVGTVKRTSDGKNLVADIYPKTGFTVFNTAKEKEKDVFRGQPLSLGNWIAISGAAVSTGLGGAGSLGISLLTGFFNLRLGYWWDSGTKSIAAGERTSDKSKPNPSLIERIFHGAKLSRNLGKWLAWLLPVQSSLIDEFLGRFHGTARRYWNLTDGGHFENLAGYELIRRRLPLIVILDSGGDAEYRLVDLANLIRKARLDFNAEIEFLDPTKDEGNSRPFSDGINRIINYFDALDISRVGTLDQLRRGKWAEEPVKERTAFFKSPDVARLSLRNAALAKITYLDGLDPPSYLLLIKPTLIGDEPADLLNYHAANPDFPQQSTADQFFDEAQWESYRRLGQHIGEGLFGIK